MAKKSPNHPVPPEAISKLIVGRKEYEEREIIEYVESQAPDEIIRHLEKVKTEFVMGRRYEVWDVLTDQDRWWVITSPTNLYSQREFRSLDYTLSFHIGVTLRVFESQSRSFNKKDEEKIRLASCWRRLHQADQAFEEADEAEEFQTIGMRCRECLLDLIASTSHVVKARKGQTLPKRADFVNWAPLIAETISGGKDKKDLRSLLKTISKSTWDYVNWLTHARNATRINASLALMMTETLVTIYGMLLIPYEREVPSRCPVCRSYRIESDFRPDLDERSPYISICAVCGWSPSKPKRKRLSRPGA